MSKYTIRRGDTLTGIADKFNTSVSALARANHISDPNLIITGDKLKVPAGKDGFENHRGGSSRRHPGKKHSTAHHGGSSSSTHHASHGGSTHHASHSGSTHHASHSGATHHASHSGTVEHGVHVTHSMRRLASNARSTALGMGGYRGQGYCATGVSRSIAKAMGIRVWGNGNQIDNNLPKSKFREVHMPLSQALRIPGVILTWEHTSTRLGSRYGHTAITLGDGHSSASDFIERDTLAGNRSRRGLKMFVPIE